MFRKKKTKINGIELPDEFSGASIINNIAISPDGTKYAYVTKSKDLITGEMPEDGKLEIEGNVINYKRNKGFGGFSYNNIKMSGSKISITSSMKNVTISSGGLENEIDESYQNINAVSINSHVNDIELELSEDDKVYLNGSIESEPILNNGKLKVSSFGGTVSIPKKKEDVTLDIKVSTGNIEGDVAHEGNLETSTGDISIDLYSPLTVHTLTSVGDINIKKMICEENDLYIPPDKKPVGNLYLKTSGGDIKVKYHKND